MNLSFISVKQQISANLESEGIQATIPVGGIHDVKGDNGVSLTTANADLIYSLKLKAMHADNQATWNLKTNYITDTGGQSGSSTIISSQTMGNAALGLDGNSVGVSNSHVMALYFQADKDNTGDIIIADNANVGYLPDITFKGGSDTTVRSALFNIQTSTSGTAPVLTIDFTAIGDKVEAIYLAKKT
tara:strand:- start:2153 stop:2713 length:561 start_codon:yes stop_codon:yes gene_type:complete